jgi:hypothetical protein
MPFFPKKIQLKEKQYEISSFILNHSCDTGWQGDHSGVTPMLIVSSIKLASIPIFRTQSLVEGYSKYATKTPLVFSTE